MDFHINIEITKEYYFINDWLIDCIEFYAISALLMRND